MSSTSFVNGITLTDAGWFNDVNTVTYTGLTTQMLVGGGTGVLGVWTAATGTGAPVRAGSPTFTGTVALPIVTTTGSLNINSGKMTVDATTGNTVVAGYLRETGGEAYTDYKGTATITQDSGTHNTDTVTVAAYRKLGKTLFLIVEANTTTATGTPSEIRISLPAGYLVLDQIASTPAIVGPGGSLGAGFMVANAGAGYISFKLFTGNWAATVNYIRGSFVIEVQ
jgi:hypothetical protein